jgi:cobalamin biosynthesis protein CobT
VNGENEGSGEGEETADEEGDADADGNGDEDSSDDQAGEDDADSKGDDKDGAADDAEDPDGAGDGNKDDQDDGEKDADGDADDTAEAPGGGEGEEQDEPDDGEGEAGSDAQDEPEGENADDGAGDDNDEPADDEGGDDAQGSDAAGDDAEKDDEGGEDADGGAPSLNNVAIELGDTDPESDDDGAEHSDENNDLEIAGIGYDPSQNPFSEMTEDALNEKDLSSALVKIIVKQAIDACRAADYSIFTREYDVIRTLQVPENFNSRLVVELEDQTRALTGVMQKDIERMMAAQSRVFNVAGQRSGRLNSAGLHRLTAGDSRVFSRREEIRAKDTAVSLLSDCSGSMKGAPMATALSASYALAQVLERCNIPAECMGFTTASMWGGDSPLTADKIAEFNSALNLEVSKSGMRFNRTHPIYMPIFKEFHERINAEVKKRFAYQRKHQPWMGGNIDGESLEYAAMRLAKRKEKRKVIIVLSDGFPAGADGDDEHLKYMVERLTNLGYDLVGIGIKSEAVRRFYDNAIVLDKVEDLPRAVMGELKKILMK